MNERERRVGRHVRLSPARNPVTFAAMTIRNLRRNLKANTPTTLPCAYVALYHRLYCCMEMSLPKKSRFDGELEAFEALWCGNPYAANEVKMLLNFAQNCRKQLKELSDRGVPAWSLLEPILTFLAMTMSKNNVGRLELKGPEDWQATVSKVEQFAAWLASLCFPIAQAANPKLLPTKAVVELLDWVSEFRKGAFTDIHSNLQSGVRNQEAKKEKSSDRLDKDLLSLIFPDHTIQKLDEIDYTWRNKVSVPLWRRTITEKGKRGRRFITPYVDPAVLAWVLQQRVRRITGKPNMNCISWILTTMLPNHFKSQADAIKALENRLNRLKRKYPNAPEAFKKYELYDWNQLLRSDTNPRGYLLLRKQSQNSRYSEPDAPHTN